jgi:hypothetical protein
VPATEDQVRRLAAQRRIFRVEGRPFVATRDGGFFETWATLAALIEKHRPATSDPSAETSTAPAQEAVPRSDAEPSPAPAEPDGTTERIERGVPAPRPGKARAPRTKPVPADTEAAPASGAAAEAPEAEEMLAGVADAQGHASRARVVGRGHRAGQPPTPRWMVAGKMRRGRLK